MWYLKIKYKHGDCLYTQKAYELGISLFHHYLGTDVKGNYAYVSALQNLIGKEENIKEYINYLKKSKKIIHLEVYDKAVFILAKHKKELETYTALYNPMFVYPNPAIVDKNGFEVVELAYWEKKPLQKVITSLKKDKTTTHIEILKFVKKNFEDVYISKLLPRLAPQQEKAVKLAYQEGYYTFPRKIDLGTLAKLAKVTKATFRENLRKAEAKLIPQLVSKK